MMYGGEGSPNRWIVGRIVFLSVWSRGIDVRHPVCMNGRGQRARRRQIAPGVLDERSTGTSAGFYHAQHLRGGDLITRF